METDLTQILSEVDEQLDKIAADNRVSKIANYIKENLGVKSNFMNYLVKDYSKTYLEKTGKELNLSSNTIRYYSITALTAAGFMALFSYVTSDLQSSVASGLLYGLGVIFVGSFAAISSADFTMNLINEKKRKNRNVYLKKAVESAITQGYFKEKVLKFYNERGQK